MPRDSVEQLTRIILSAESDEDLAVLLRGLLTPQEIEEVVLRWRLMVRLCEGQTQRDIAQELGVSLGKIARGSRLLKYELPDFGKVLTAVRQKLEDESQN